MKKTVPKTIFFSLAFLNRFWVDFGRVLGGVWGGFGDSFLQLGRTFSKLLDHFLIFCCLKALEAHVGIQFGCLKRFREGFGGVLEWFWGLFFATWVYIFQIACPFLDFLMFEGTRRTFYPCWEVSGLKKSDVS